MKGFIALVLVAMVGISAWNAWEIHAMREEIATLNQKVNSQSQSGVTDEVVAKAVAALALAKDAMGRMDTSQARAAYDTARQRLDEAAKVANAQAAPKIKWLRDEASDLGRQLQDKINRR